MRRLLLCALVAAGCGGSSGLGANDVELTINTRANAVNDDDLATVTALELTLTGSQNDHTRYDLSRPFKRAETLVVHLTKATGDLTIGGVRLALHRERVPAVVTEHGLVDPLHALGLGRDQQGHAQPFAHLIRLAPHRLVEAAHRALALQPHAVVRADGVPWVLPGQQR